MNINYNNAQFEAAYGNLSQICESSLPEVVFSGRSNVGKSSLINKLINRKSLARVSAKPGKTGTINFYNLGDIRLVDLPGYGYARVSMSEKKRWASLVEGYFNSNRNIKLVIQIVDMRHPPTNDDIHMIDYLYTSKFPFLIVLTKSDKLKALQRVNRMEGFEKELSFYKKDIEMIPFSCITGEGVDEIKDIINCSTVS